MREEVNISIGNKVNESKEGGKENKRGENRKKYISVCDNLRVNPPFYKSQQTVSTLVLKNCFIMKNKKRREENPWVVGLYVIPLGLDH